MSKRVTWMAVAALALGAAPTRAVWAQVDERAPVEEELIPAPEPAPIAEPAPAPNVRLLAADGLARLALTILRDQQDVQPDDYRIVAMALRTARQMADDGPDEELLRLEREAWQYAGDEAEALELTRELVRIAPKDTVALLAVLNARIRELQDADQRLAAFDRLLGPEGAALHPSVRSRLALDAALIARENGDEEGFIRRLTEATTLDVTNKDAAVLYATYFLERTDDPRERADMLANVILADPTDLHAHTNLAMEMWRRGAFKASSRFFDCAARLMLASGQSLSDDDLFDRIVLTWLDEGEAAAETHLEAMHNEFRAIAQAERRRKEQLREELGPEVEPRLPPRFELLRLAMAFAEGDQERVEASVASIAASTDEQLQRIEELKPPYDRLSEAERNFGARQIRLEQLFARLWGGSQIEEAEATFKKLMEEEAPLAPDAKLRLEGMLDIRTGNVDAGIEKLRNAHPDDLAAGLGLAIGLEVAGRRDEAIRAYAKLAYDNLTTAIGAAARMRVQTLVGEQLAPGPVAQSLEDWGRNLAPWLDTVVQEPRRFMSLSARHVEPSIDVFDRIVVEITLRNISRWPLALGPTAPINSRFLITPRVTVMGRDTTELATPEVVEMSRRLRLEPGEELRVRVRGSRGPVGALAQLTANRATGVRWRVLQGYRMDQMRFFQPGELSLSAETDLLTIRTIADKPDDEIIQAIREAQGREWYEAILLAQGSGARRRGGETVQRNLERRQAFAQALADRLPTLNEYERLWVVSVAMPGGLFHSGPTLVDAFRNETSSMVNAALLVGPYRSDVTENPPDLSSNPDPTIARMGAIVNAFRARMYSSR